MRRSSSQSHIPVRLFGASASATSNQLGANRDSARLRSNSTNRLSQKDSGLKPRRSSSADSRRTPLNRQRNSQKITPAYLRTNSSTKSKISPASGIKERKTIQKLSSDKQWVATQFSKVQHFISTSDIFDGNIVTPNDLQPMTTKAFVYIVNVLMSNIFPIVNITMENYKEEITKKLKVLNYPGTLAMSTLKTVNTTHSWPQIIGMIGWLVDKVDLVNNVNIHRLAMSVEENQKYFLLELGTRYILDRYNNFNDNGKDLPEEVEKIDEKFKQDFAGILKLDTEEYLQLEREVEEKKQYKEALEKEIIELTAIKKSLEEEKDSGIQSLNTLMEANATEDARIEEEIKKYSALSSSLSQREKELNANILKLEKTIEKQPCSYKEKKNMLQNIKNLKNENNILKEKIDHAQSIKNEFDVNISNEFEKLQSKVITWNRSLMELCIKKPHLKSLLLNETGFHRKEFLDEIREVAKRNEEIEIEVTKIVQSLENELTNVNKRINIILKESNDIQENTNETIKRVEELSENKAILEKNTQEALTSWESKKRNLTDLSESEDSKQLKLLLEEKQKLSKKEHELNVRLEILKRESVQFFLGLHEGINANMSGMNNVLEKMKNRVEELSKKVLQEKTEFNKFLESLDE